MNSKWTFICLNVCCSGPRAEVFLSCLHLSIKLRSSTSCWQVWSFCLCHVLAVSWISYSFLYLFFNQKVPILMQCVFGQGAVYANIAVVFLWRELCRPIRRKRYPRRRTFLKLSQSAALKVLIILTLTLSTADLSTKANKMTSVCSISS